MSRPPSQSRTHAFPSPAAWSAEAVGQNDDREIVYAEIKRRSLPRNCAGFYENQASAQHFAGGVSEKGAVGADDKDDLTYVEMSRESLLLLYQAVESGYTRAEKRRGNVSVYPAWDYDPTKRYYDNNVHGDADEESDEELQDYEPVGNAEIFGTKERVIFGLDEKSENQEYESKIEEDRHDGKEELQTYEIVENPQLYNKEWIQSIFHTKPEKQQECDNKVEEKADDGIEEIQRYEPVENIKTNGNKMPFQDSCLTHKTSEKQGNSSTSKSKDEDMKDLSSIRFSPRPNPIPRSAKGNLSNLTNYFEMITKKGNYYEICKTTEHETRAVVDEAENKMSKCRKTPIKDSNASLKVPDSTGSNLKSEEADLKSCFKDEEEVYQTIHFMTNKPSPHTTKLTSGISTPDELYEGIEWKPKPARPRKPSPKVKKRPIKQKTKKFKIMPSETKINNVQPHLGPDEGCAEVLLPQVAAIPSGAWRASYVDLIASYEDVKAARGSRGSFSGQGSAEKTVDNNMRRSKSESCRPNIEEGERQIRFLASCMPDWSRMFLVTEICINCLLTFPCFQFQCMDGVSRLT